MRNATRHSPLRIRRVLIRNGECVERVECQMHNAKCSMKSFPCIDFKQCVSLLLDLPDMPLFGAARVAHSGSNVTLICIRGSTSAQNVVVRLVRTRTVST